MIGKFHNMQENKVHEKKYIHKKYTYHRNKILRIIFLIFIFIVVLTGKIVVRHKMAVDDIYPAEVVWVIDGDTMILNINGCEKRVRLIGVDCPESVSEIKEENTIYGKFASEFSKRELYTGMKVYITYDEEKTDQYGRMLVYLWTGEEVGNLDFLYQKKIVDEGYALAVSYEPNTLYAEELHQSMIRAQEEQKGLWSYEKFYEEYKYVIYP